MTRPARRRNSRRLGAPRVGPWIEGAQHRADIGRSPAGSPMSPPPSHVRQASAARTARTGSSGAGVESTPAPGGGAACGPLHRRAREVPPRGRLRRDVRRGGPRCGVRARGVHRRCRHEGGACRSSRALAGDRSRSRQPLHRRHRRARCPAPVLPGLHRHGLTRARDRGGDRRRDGRRLPGRRLRPAGRGDRGDAGHVCPRGDRRGRNHRGVGPQGPAPAPPGDDPGRRRAGGGGKFGAPHQRLLADPATAGGTARGRRRRRPDRCPAGTAPQLPAHRDGVLRGRGRAEGPGPPPAAGSSTTCRGCAGPPSAPVWTSRLARCPTCSPPWWLGGLDGSERSGSGTWASAPWRSWGKRRRALERSELRDRTLPTSRSRRQPPRSGRVGVWR